MEKLQSRRSPERAATIHFLGESRHPQALGILSRLLADSRDPHRDVAARALGLLGDPGAVGSLTAARSDADSELKSDIDAALQKLRMTKDD